MGLPPPDLWVKGDSVESPALQKKNVSDIPVPSRDVTKLSRRESLVSDIPAGDGNVAKLFVQCVETVKK